MILYNESSGERMQLFAVIAMDGPGVIPLARKQFALV
jgi:hypothetical protein